MFEHRLARVLTVLSVLASLSIGASLLVSPGPAHADVLACGNTITSNVKLTADVTGCTGDGLIVGADNVTIDGGGHSLLGASSRFSGIVVDGHRNVRIKNVTVGNFCVGVDIGNSTGVTLSNVVIDFNQCAFVSISDSERVSISGSTFSSSGGAGVIISSSDKVKLMNNQLGGADSGFVFIEVDGARVVRNASNGTYLGNFVLDGTTNSTFMQNEGFVSNSEADFVVDADSTGNRFARNSSTSGTDSFVDESSGDGTAGTANTYQGNTCIVPSSPEGLCTQP
jgi:hypothetical protein